MNGKRGVFVQEGLCPPQNESLEDEARRRKSSTHGKFPEDACLPFMLSLQLGGAHKYAGQNPSEKNASQNRIEPP